MKMDLFQHPPTKICRLCLAPTRAYFSITESERISDMLEALTSMKIVSTDEISTILCLKCRLNLSLAYTIQQNMLKAEERFREKLAFSIKQEIVIVEEELKKESKNEKVQDLSLVKKALQNLKEHPCDVCGRVYLTKHMLSRHKYSHRRKKCQICGKEMTLSNLRMHMEIHVGSPHVCELCGATLKNKVTLKQHMFYSHHESRHKCQFCDKVFKKKTDRDGHQKKDHGGEANYVCDSCGKKFYTKGHLTVHVKMTHLKLRPFVCKFCNGVFSSRYALQTHQRQHTNETPYRCEVCGDGFRQKVSLKSHLKSKHDIVEEETCQCTICGKGFATTHALYSHQRVHS